MERTMEQAVFSGKSEQWNRQCLVGNQDRAMEQAVFSGETGQGNGTGSV